MENGEQEGVYVQGSRVPITKGEFQSLCDQNDAGTFLAKCGPWHKMDKKLVDIQNGGPDLMDEIMDAKCCAMKIKEPWLQRKHDVCGCYVRSKIRLFKKKKTTEMALMIKWRSGSKLRSVLRGWSDRFIVKC